MELKENCPNCGRQITLQPINGTDLLDEVEAIACVTFSLLGALAGVVLIWFLSEVYPDFTPDLSIYGIAAIVVATPVFFVSLRWLTAFERNKLRSLGVQKLRLECSCFPQDIVVVRSVTTAEANAPITVVAETAHE